jgi:predicted Fe-Mo cluster-binding NifX family protein
MLKIAVSSEGPSLDDQVDPRFGRAAGFVIVDLNTMESAYIDNGRSQVLSQGAGIQAAELIARAGVSCLLTGFVGPKAFQALTAAGIKVGQNLEGLTVRQAVERYQSGQVEMARAANRQGR